MPSHKRQTRGPATLTCLHCQAWTEHKFSHTALGVAGPEHVEFYRCGVCGDFRAWGIVLPQYAVQFGQRTATA